MPQSPRNEVRAAVPEYVLEAIAARAPEAEVLSLDRADLETIDFVVPTSDRRDVLDVLPDLRRLAVVQTLSAGTDWVQAVLPAQATLGSARGARDGPVAEWIVGALLGVSARLLEFAHRREWELDQGIDDLESWTVLIVGMGSIGHRVAELLTPFRSRVVGVASHAHDGLHGIDELGALLPDADAVVVLAPLTDGTRGLIGARELGVMKPDATLVNVARGAIVDEQALYAHLAANPRFSAAIDAWWDEPRGGGQFHTNYPFFELPNVLGSPHNSGDVPGIEEFAARRAAENVRRFLRGEPVSGVARRADYAGFR
jgi:phosphoglycerate dehydrogenase-like enzyme